MPVPTKSGFAFAGWYLGSTLIHNGDLVEITRDCTFVAHWTADTYTITFDANGGSVSPTSMEVAYNGTYDLPTPTRSGFLFTGWYLGNQRTNNHSTVNLTQNETFVAQWSTDFSCQINYINTLNPNDYAVQPFTFGQPVTLDPCSFNGNGYYFWGWINFESRETYYDGETVTFTQEDLIDHDVVLVSLWSYSYGYPPIDPFAGGMRSGGATLSSVKTYAYDLSGNRISFSLSVNNETPKVTTYTYDNLNRLLTTSQGGTSAAYTYDANGNRASVTYDNGLYTTYTYNAANLLTQLTNHSANNAVLSQYTYTHYLDGNQKTKTDKDNRITTYVYDGLGRLVSEEEKLVGQTLFKAEYTFDDFSNRASMVVTGLNAYAVN